MFTIKQNDTSPAIRAALKTQNSNPVNLIGANVRFHMRDEDHKLLVDNPAVVEDQEGGIVRYDWEMGDTNTTGVCFGEFEVTYEDESIETFPNNGYIKIKVVEEIA